MGFEEYYQNIMEKNNTPDERKVIMSYTEWNEERLQSPWHQARIKKHGSWEGFLEYTKQKKIKKHGSWEGYLEYVKQQRISKYGSEEAWRAHMSKTNGAGGAASKGKKKPGAGRYKPGDIEARLNGKKGGDKRWKSR